MKAPILRKETLAPGISRMVLSAPEVAAHAAAGQFIILRPTENGERIPLTISDFDPKAGTVTIVYQVVGGTTLLLDSLRPVIPCPPSPALWAAPATSQVSRMPLSSAADWAAPSPCPLPLPCTAGAAGSPPSPGSAHPAGHPGAGNGRLQRPFSPLQR